MDTPTDADTMQNERNCQDERRTKWKCPVLDSKRQGGSIELEVLKNIMEMELENSDGKSESEIAKL
jgi:hypothetical protein